MHAIRIAIAEQQRNAPQAGDAHHRIDDAADDRGLTAANVGNQIEAEQAHQQPVDAADDGQYQ